MSLRALVRDHESISLKGPVASLLLEFNLLPSRTLHPTQVARLDPPEGLAHAQPAVAAALHKRWSARLLETLGSAGTPVLNGREPALPLALATPALLKQLARDLGIALLGNYLRRVIDRQEVVALRSTLGMEGMVWALEGAPELHPGLPDPGKWLKTDVHSAAHPAANAADRLGAGLLAHAWHDAPAPLRQRANWKLPPEGQSPEFREAHGLKEPQARELCLKRLSQLEPAWLSFFP